MELKTFIGRLSLAALVGLSLVLLFSSVRLCWKESRDFPQYYAAAKLYVAGEGAKVYQPEALSAVEHKAYPQMPPEPALFCYPPYALPMLAWLAPLPAGLCARIWTLLSIASLAGAIWIIGTHFKMSTKTLVLLSLLIPLTGPFCESIIKGQPTSFMLLGIATAALGLRRKNDPLAAAGLCLLLPKPHILLPFVVFLLGAGRFKVVAILSGLSALLLAISLYTANINAFADYLRFMRSISSNVAVMHLQSCPTLRSQLIRVLPNYGTIIGLTSTVLFGAVTATMFFLGRYCRNHDQSIEVMLLSVLPLTAVFSIYFQSYDTLLILPAVLVWIGAQHHERLMKWVVLVGILSAPALFAPLYSAIYHAPLAVNVHFLLLLSFATLCAIGSHALLNRTEQRQLQVATSTQAPQ